MNIRNFLWTYREGENGDGGGDGGGGGGDWRQALPEDLRADTALKSINSLEDLAKGYVGISRMMGSRVPIPGKDAAPDIIKEFRSKIAGVDGVLLYPDEGDEQGMAQFLTKLGRPESPEGYKIQRPSNLPEGMPVDENMEKAVLQRLHKAGASNKQAQDIVGMLYEFQAKAYQADLEANQAARTALEQKWGAAYDQNLGIAKTVLAKYGSEQLAQELEGQLGDHPGLTELLVNLGKLTLEDTVLRNLSGGGDMMRTLEEVQADIDEVTKNPAYMNPRDPTNRTLVAKATKLFQERARLTGG